MPFPGGHPKRPRDTTVGHHPLLKTLGQIGELGDQGPLYLIGGAVVAAGAIRRDAQVEAIERGAFKNVRLIRKYSDIIQCQNDGWNGILTYKQLDEWPSSGRLEIPMIADWKARGLRIFQLSYAVTDRSSEDVRASRLGHAGFQKGGLTDLGREVVEELNRLNMVVDVSHCNDETVIETCARSTSPVIASHANALAISPSGRNKGDEALLAIKRSGGLIGVTPVGWMFENPETKDRSISQLVNHMDHIRKVIGTEYLAVASDSHYDGWPVDSPNYACPQLAAPRRWKHVAKEMLRRGYTEEDLEKVFSTNWLRILKATLQP